MIAGKLLMPLALLLSACGSPSADMNAQDAKVQKNIDLVKRSFDLMIKAETLEEGAKHIAPGYIQHNPNVASGREALLALAKRTITGHVKLPERAGAPTWIGQGDLVMVMMPQKRKHPTKPDTTYVAYGFDMWRVQDGQIVEHWDSEQIRDGW